MKYKMSKSEQLIFQSLFYFKRDKAREREDVQLKSESFMNGLAFALAVLLRRDLANLGLTVHIKSVGTPESLLDIRIYDEEHSERRKISTGEFIFSEDPKILFEETITELSTRVLEAR